jgi:hypothetical protein
MRQTFCKKFWKNFFNKVFKENSRGKKIWKQKLYKKYIDNKIQKKNEINILQKVLKEFFQQSFQGKFKRQKNLRAKKL